MEPATGSATDETIHSAKASLVVSYIRPMWAGRQGGSMAGWLAASFPRVFTWTPNSHILNRLYVQKRRVGSGYTINVHGV